MEKVKTEDGSETFKSKKYKETYHSTTGALEESFKKFAEPCKIKDGMKILDVCFGIGYNSLAAICTADVEITALENDPEILMSTEEVKIPKEYKENYEKIKKAAEELNYSDSKVKIKVLLGDARETIDKLEDGYFDVVFLDPFSPKVCPELWDEDFIRKIARKMKVKGVLATYSCASLVRKNLKKTGLRAEDGPKVGRRSPATLAYKDY